MKKISKFNIRTTFDKLQNNVQNQKTVDLINTLQKKILNEENNLPRDNSSSFQNKQKKMVWFHLIQLMLEQEIKILVLPSVKEETI